MSIQAMSWAFEIELRPAALKFLLVCLADNASHNGVLFPSVKALEIKTCLDRKTIIAGIDTLEELGFLTDTGRRVGKTNQVKVYALTGFDSGDRHYNYRVTDTETGEFYIGVRSCSGDPLNDAAYIGSGKWPLAAARARRPLRKEVLQVYMSREEAEVEERRRISEALSDGLCRNKPGEARAYRKASENVTLSKQGGVKAPTPTGEASRTSAERLPQTGHGTVKEPSKEPSKEPQSARPDPVPGPREELGYEKPKAPVGTVTRALEDRQLPPTGRGANFEADFKSRFGVTPEEAHARRQGAKT